MIEVRQKNDLFMKIVVKWWIPSNSEEVWVSRESKICLEIVDICVEDMEVIGVTGTVKACG